MLQIQLEDPLPFSLFIPQWIKQLTKVKRWPSPPAHHLHVRTLDAWKWDSAGGWEWACLPGKSSWFFSWLHLGESICNLWVLTASSLWHLQWPWNPRICSSLPWKVTVCSRAQGSRHTEPSPRSLIEPRPMPQAWMAPESLRGTGQLTWLLSLHPDLRTPECFTNTCPWSLASPEV